jgi:hypothetical protein
MRHTFSVEIKSKKFIKILSISKSNGVLFEGSLGELQDLLMIEDAALELKGTYGVLRVDLTEKELLNILKKKKGEKS